MKFDPIRREGTVERARYLDQLVQQAIHWVNGRAVHVPISDECVPDFSCCHPDLGENTTQEHRLDHLRQMIELRRSENASYQAKE